MDTVQPTFSFYLAFYSAFWPPVLGRAGGQHGKLLSICYFSLSPSCPPFVCIRYPLWLFVAGGLGHEVYLFGRVARTIPGDAHSLSLSLFIFIIGARTHVYTLYLAVLFLFELLQREALVCKEMTRSGNFLSTRPLIRGSRQFFSVSRRIVRALRSWVSGYSE